MDYTELTTAIQDYTEKTFTADQLARFVKQAETKIYRTVDNIALPTDTAFLTVAADASSFSAPAGTLYIYSVEAVGTPSGARSRLLQKDYAFLREAFPDITANTGTPRYYAYYEYSGSDVITIKFAPAADQSYSIRLMHAIQPTSIVTATNTWLGDNFDDVLFKGALIEAGIFLKEEPDVMKMYEDEYKKDLIIMREMVSGKMHRDSYRNGEYRYDPDAKGAVQ